MRSDTRHRNKPCLSKKFSYANKYSHMSECILIWNSHITVCKTRHRNVILYSLTTITKILYKALPDCNVLDDSLILLMVELFCHNILSSVFNYEQISFLRVYMCVCLLCYANPPAREWYRTFSMQSVLTHPKYGHHAIRIPTWHSALSFPSI